MLLTKLMNMMAVLVVVALVAFGGGLLGHGIAAGQQKESARTKGNPDPSPLPAPLTIGNPSPKLVAMKYVRGDAVKELSAGTIYVVEFSGTECVPCIECIPHMNELHNKHTSVVFISIFNENEKAVRGFLAGKGKDIAFRVAVDPTGGMGRGWTEPAYREGIPQVFIVGKDGRIAWIGHPVELAEPLAQIVADTFDAQEYVLRLKVEQEATLRLRQRNEREERGRDEYKRINEMVIAGKLVDALAETEKALAVYHGFPRATELLQGARVYLLANLPGKREEAFKLATELAIEAKMSGRWAAMANGARALLSAAEGAEAGVRDKRLIDLALPLICDPSPADPDLRHQSEDSLRNLQIVNLRTRGRAYHLRGDTARATGSIREAIEMIRALKPPPNADEKKFAEDVKQRLEQFQAILREYSQEGRLLLPDRSTVGKAGSRSAFSQPKVSLTRICLAGTSTA